MLNVNDFTMAFNTCQIWKFALYMVHVVLTSIASVNITVAEITCQQLDSLQVSFGDEADDVEYLQNATKCDIPNCHNDCSCSLGNNSTFVAICSGGNATLTDISFPQTIETLYLGNNWLGEISPFAFNKVGNGCKKLYLNNNKLTDIHPGAFTGLSKVEFLSFYGNELSELRLGVFTGLGALLELNIEHNKLTTLQPGILRDVKQLQKLYLDNNEITALQYGLFDGVEKIREIDVDRNLLKHVDEDVFHGLTDLVELDLDNNKISMLQPAVFHGLINVKKLELDENYLMEIPKGIFKGLRKVIGLTISFNFLQKLDLNVFEGLHNLKEIYLQYNSLDSLHPSLFEETLDLEVLYINHNKLEQLPPDVFENLANLKILSIAQNNLLYLQSEIFRDLRSLEFLNMSGNNMNEIAAHLFQRARNLLILDLTQNSLYWITTGSFKDLSKLTIVYVDEYATCCFIDSTRCSFNSPPSPFISCKRLLPISILRVMIWVVAISTIAGNAFVLLKRYKQRKEQASVQYLLITNLSISDSLTGIYLFILLSADIHYKDFFPSHSESWRHSMLCRFAGTLSLLSSEASVFLITLISIDRYMSIRLKLSSTSLNNKSAKIAITILWLIAALISLSSLLIPFISPSFYKVSEMCVGLPISRVNIYNTSEISFNLNTTSIEEDVNIGHAVQVKLVGSNPSMFFSIAVFTVLNLICFVIVAFCYASIFITAKQASRVGGLRTNKDREIRRALKMATIVISDFCCWMVVVVLSILVQNKVVTLNPEVYAWIATFILPINSCMNPFLYTFSSLISKRLRRRIDHIDTNNTGIRNNRSHPPNDGGSRQLITVDVRMRQPTLISESHQPAVDARLLQPYEEHSKPLTVASTSQQLFTDTGSPTFNDILSQSIIHSKSQLAAVDGRSQRSRSVVAVSQVQNTQSHSMYFI